jgi:hypothetical protein
MKCGARVGRDQWTRQRCQGAPCGWCPNIVVVLVTLQTPTRWSLATRCLLRAAPQSARGPLPITAVYCEAGAMGIRPWHWWRGVLLTVTCPPDAATQSGLTSMPRSAAVTSKLPLEEQLRGRDEPSCYRIPSWGVRVGVGPVTAGSHIRHYVGCPSARLC